MFLKLKRAAFGRWGGADAWAIWTFHAKYLFYDNWYELLQNYIDLTHPDYPLFLPSLITIFWKA